MTTIAEVRTALAYAVSRADGLDRCDAYLSADINPPCAQIGRGAMDPRMVMSKAKAQYQFKVNVYVDRTVELQAQERLDEFCLASGASSITAAIEDETNWNGEVDYAVVTNIGDTQAVTVAESQYLTVAFDVEVVW